MAETHRTRTFITATNENAHKHEITSTIHISMAWFSSLDHYTRIYASIIYSKPSDETHEKDRNALWLALTHTLALMYVLLKTHEKKKILRMNSRRLVDNVRTIDETVSNRLSRGV